MLYYRQEKQQIKIFQKLADLYSTESKNILAFEIITLPDIKEYKKYVVEEQKIKEGKKIIQSLNNDDYVIFLDERGKEFRTIEFSALLEKIFMLPKKRIVFVIGVHGDFQKRFMTGLISECLFQK